MLSRVANRIFWLSRYMERSENIARLVKVYSHLLLDLPKNDNVDRFRLVEIFGAVESFDRFYAETDELTIMKFLLTEKRYYGSIISSLKFARENARITREVFPIEVWDIINETYMSFNELEGNEDSRSARHKALNAMIYSGQRFEGIISGGMSRNDIYSFFVLGKMLERADMTTRVLDVGTIMLSGEIDGISAYRGIIWMNLLKSVNSYQMYRKNIKIRISGPDVVKFLLFDSILPRSVRYCIETMNIFSQQLPNSKSVSDGLTRIIKFIDSVDIDSGNELNVHSVMDDIQKMLIDIGDEIASTWFNTDNPQFEEDKCQ